MKRLITILLLLSACGTLNPVTLYQLSQVSPLEADPADFTVAIDVSKGVAIAPGSARLVLTVKRAEDAREGQFILQRIAAPGSGLPKPTGAFALFRVAQADLTRMRLLQATALGWETEDPDGTSGSLSALLTACSNAPGPAPDAVTSVFLRVAPEGAFLPLAKQVPLRQLAENGFYPCKPDS